ncbi:starch synthase [candidate division WWE3 bacterium CG_4_10_14_0_2_um_filter_42_7]|uniref:Glycogen synthase n=2 Tax=Katanobacteria TaxID=422282 RepID=A0A2H0X8Y8_UNCKA|nr:MAG: starch synthase [candidate division WWE3 bacterium CG08_land_8_20_14_0_20_41_15]PIZ42781.1 MAG: starch synthase [candidate division WWE3 bacterium CG_4_10_14_0_2_um_filter_42_7]
MQKKSVTTNRVRVLTPEQDSLKQKPLKVLIVIAESAPYASVAGLSRTAPYLARAISALGHDVRIFMPKFGLIDETKYKMEMIYKDLKVPTGLGVAPQFLICNVKMHKEEEGVPTYFLENQEYYEQRANVYGYSDDQVRWALLARGCLEFVKVSDWKPDVIHSNDWHTGMVPNYMASNYAKDEIISKISSLFTIHNMQFQGMFDHHNISDLDFDDGRSQIASFFSERLSKQNFMKRGIIYADAVNTVSETYAREILTPAFGEGIDRLLIELRSKLFGVVNGIDYNEFNPATDKLVKYNFDVETVSRRKLNKIALQKDFGLPEKEDAFLVGIVSRLVEQKGIDLIGEVMRPFLKDFNAQLVVVGGGDNKYIDLFKDLQKNFPTKVSCHLMLNYTLPRMVFSGCDVVLIPSRFEPCGVVQLEAMRYGAVPIVRHTGGLADTVENFDSAKGTGTGFSFNDFDRWAFFAQLVRAYEVFQNDTVWNKLVKRVMLADFSWEHSAKEYVRLYERAIHFRNQRLASDGDSTPKGLYEN